jgi:hypothetical protein
VFRDQTPITDNTVGNLSFIANITTNGYIDQGVFTAGFYYYAVVAFNSTGNSTPSNNVIVDVHNPPISPIWIPPLNNTLINTINLTWSDIYNYDNYSVYRTNSSTWDSMDNILIGENISQLNYIDHPQIEGIYYYWLFATNTSGTSLLGTQLTIHVLIMNTPDFYAIPGGPVINHTIVIAWSPVNHTTQYYLYRSSTSQISIDQLTPYQIFASNITNFTDNNMPLGNYYYLLVPMSLFGQGNQSSILEIQVQDLPASPIITDAISGYMDNVQIFWNASISADHYIAYMGYQLITFNTSLSNLIASPMLDADMLNYTFTSARFGDHWFVVVAINATGTSNISNIFYFNNLSGQSTGLPNQVEILIIAGTSISVGVVTIVIIFIIRKRRNSPERLFEKLTNEL